MLTRSTQTKRKKRRRIDLFFPLCFLCVLRVLFDNCSAATVEGAKKILFIAGTKSHGPGEHEYEKGLRLLKNALDTSPNIKNIKTGIALDGWPKDESSFDGVDTIVMYCDGSDRDENAHP